MQRIKTRLSARGTALQKLEEQMEALQRQMNVIARDLAALRNFPRPDWNRYTAPMDLDIEEMPTAQLQTVPSPEIGRITIDQFSYVRVFRPNGTLVARFCGPFDTVGRQLLRESGPKRWEQIDFYDLPRLATPETPIPATHRNLV